MTSLNKVRGKNVHNKSHELHGLCAMCLTLFLYVYLIYVPPHIELYVRPLSQAVNFKHRFNHKDQGGFSMAHKEGHLLVDG